MIEELKKELLGLQDKKYQKFSSSLLPEINNIIGIRLPILRKIAQKITKNDYETFFKENDNSCFELTMLEGMIIGNIKEDFNITLKRLEKFIPKIDNWSVCDSTVTSLKTIKDNKNKTKNFLKKYLDSTKEFELRFGFVVLLNYFIKDDFDYVFDNISKFSNETYYSKMAVAWCLSYCFIYDFNKTIEKLKACEIHPWVLKKGIQKTKESFKITKEQKRFLREEMTSF